jgi:hypothetical protein
MVGRLKVAGSTFSAVGFDRYRAKLAKSDNNAFVSDLQQSTYFQGCGRLHCSATCAKCERPFA